MISPETFFPISDPNQTFLATYQEWLTQKGITPNTVRVYYSRVKNFLLFLEYANQSGHRLDEAEGMKTAATLYLDFLKAEKNATRSINANITTLNDFSRFLGLENVGLAREYCNPRPTKILSLEEQRRVLTAIEKQEWVRDRALALVLLNTGLRISDCARLNVGDVQEMSVICPDKETTVPLNEATAIALKQWLAERERLVKSELNTALWLTKDRMRLSVPGIAFVIKRIGWEAKLSISVEMLRRTWLTSQIERRSKEELATKFGGYLSAATVDRYYFSMPAD